MVKIFNKLRLGINLQGCKKGAFTLLEMIIAITVFTIFIGFAMSSYLSLHRAQEESGAERNMLFEAQNVMDILVDAIKENKIDYEAYQSEKSWAGDVLGQTVGRYYDLGFGGNVLGGGDLYLVSPGGDSLVFEWDSESGMLSMNGEGMLSDAVSVKYLNFEIFPDADPYDQENSMDDDVQFQPIVQIDITFATPGRVRDEVTLDFQTSVTSRFYQ